jgi:hypothetical protein
LVAVGALVKTVVQEAHLQLQVQELLLFLLLVAAVALADTILIMVVVQVVLGVRALQAVQVEEVVVHNMATHMEMVAVPQALQVKVMLVAMEHPMEIQAAVAVVALAQLEVLM